MLAAIEIMAGSTEMNPDLTRRVLMIEDKIDACKIFVQEMRMIVARTLSDDGDLNVHAVQKELLTVKEWMKRQAEDDRNFFKAYVETVSTDIKSSEQRIASLEISADKLHEQINNSQV